MDHFLDSNTSLRWFPEKQEVPSSKEKPSHFSAPTISLPKGGGAIRGIGEKFAANPVTGTGSLTVPIFTSPGRSGFGPQLSFSYDSGSGNGPFGFGWSLFLPSITRKTDKGLPKYQDAEESDEYVLTGSEDLVPVLKKGYNNELVFDDYDNDGYEIRKYRPRIEGLFAQIERWKRKEDGDVHWRSISKDNILTVYGRDENSRIVDPTDRRKVKKVFSWLICESYDDKGNAIGYTYVKENYTNVDLSLINESNRIHEANCYLKEIRYGNRQPLLLDITIPESFRRSHLDKPDFDSADWMFRVVFDYNEDHYILLETPEPKTEHHQLVQVSANAGGVWSSRPDPFSSYRAGFEIRTNRRCQRVLMFHCFPELGSEPYLVHSTEFNYADLNYSQSFNVETELEHRGSTRFASFIQSIIQSGYARDKTYGEFEKNGIIYGTYIKKSFPPLEFEYSKAEIQKKVVEIDRESLENLPCGLDEEQYQWVDLDGEGIPGILSEQAKTWFYKPSRGNATFGPLERVASKPSLADLGSGRSQLLDLAGDGQLDVVELAVPVPGFYERTHNKQWENFKPFRSLPHISWSDPNLRFVDLTGDGHIDIMIIEDAVIRWYPSLAEEGFGQSETLIQSLNEETGPRVVFFDGTQSIYLADMSGDGLTDLVRIRNGEVCYWPNLGYGHFGAKVTMDNAPWFDAPDQFDQKRIRLADIDGTGVNDIIYLGRDCVQIYLNQSGNRWSGAYKLSIFPQFDNLSSVQVIDLLGYGTACLVWSSHLPNSSSRPVRYIDLMGQKPHLLIKFKNNLGAETEIQYTSSTKFYLADKNEGKPWITRLPFPVHVVERVILHDKISQNRFVNRYIYHHGFFDGIEREFRGFGMVEQLDTEEFTVLIEGSDLHPVSNENPESHVPPVLTKTWYHTGFYMDRKHISNFYAGVGEGNGEYFRELGLGDEQAESLLLDDTPLPEGLNAKEECEACRALKGSILRQELYALDQTERETYPYLVSERNFRIRCLQSLAFNQHAIFYVHPSETIEYHYERNPEDPRMVHQMTLQVDDYGNVERAATIAYPRRPLMQPKLEQEETHITFTVRRFVNSPDLIDLNNQGQKDWYRIGLPIENQTYEIVNPPEPNLREGRYEPFKLENIRKELINTLFPPELTKPIAENTITHTNWNWRKDPNTPNRNKLRLIEHLRTIYRSNNLDSLLQLGVIESLALPGEIYKLAFTPDLLMTVYRRNHETPELPPEDLLPDPSEVLGCTATDGGGYVDLDGDEKWWIPSGRIFYWQQNIDDPQAELDFASEHFFLPHRICDPFGYSTTVIYDKHQLLPIITSDPLGNTILAQNNYRVLQPLGVTEPNGAVSEVLFDALGRVVATAIHKDGIGDALPEVHADLTRKELRDFYADPIEQAVFLLDKATTRVIYDNDQYFLTDDPTLPSYIACIARETHLSNPVPEGKLKVQINFSYSDGFEREIQKKIRAESGPIEEERPDAKPRWVGSGWTIFNNKGKPVRQYEPFFSPNHHFEYAWIVGVSWVLFYDPIERVVTTLHPNNTYEKVVFTPWYQMTYDVNDTIMGDPRTDSDIFGFVSTYCNQVATQPNIWKTWLQQRGINPLAPPQDLPGLENEKKAAVRSLTHADTPTIAHFDSLGRTFLTVAHNRSRRGNTHSGDPLSDDFFRTCIVFDIEGNQRELIDAKDRVVMRYHYDMLGNGVRQDSMEAGSRWVLNNTVGNPIRSWDSRYFNRRITYDPLQRHVETHATNATGTEFIAKKTIYGEYKTNPEKSNHRLKPWVVYDGAGVVVNEEYDFKGNLVRSTRQLLSGYTTQVDWNQNPPMEAEIFSSRTIYDALNRPVQIVAPHSNRAIAKINLIQPEYNEANLLEKVDVWLELDGEPDYLLEGSTATHHVVTDIDYNAKGQRNFIEYGNGVRTMYEYDEKTFRLIHLQTMRGVEPLQDLFYTYDPAGNITSIRDDALQTVYFDGGVVRPTAEYIYDAIYRLIESHGREHIGQVSQPQTSWNDHFRINLIHRNDRQKMRNYTEFYYYDEVGNFLRFEHKAQNGDWIRTFDDYEASLIEPYKKSNRLSYTVVHPDSPQPIVEPYTYDSHGNITSMPHLQHMDWDFEGQLCFVDKGTEKVYHCYDAAGQRVRKVAEKNNGNFIEERIYLGCGFEIYRRRNSNEAIALERETLHVMDDTQRIAMIETRTIDSQNRDPAPRQLMRYQFSNHLGSASLELDNEAHIISYEEYTPYGSTSYQCVRSQIETPKRYRYTGKERDEETGLYYHGARYYAPWQGRWISCEPKGLGNGLCSYAYAQSNPIKLIDPDGKKDTAPPVLRLPGTATEGQTLRKQINAQIASNPNSPVIFQDRGVSVLVMRLPEPYVVQRKAGQTFTDAAKENDTSASETVINTNFYSYSGGGGKLGAGASAYSGPTDPAKWPAIGQVLSGGKVVGGRSSPLTYHFAWTKDRPQQLAGEQEKQYRELLDPNYPVPSSDPLYHIPPDPANAWQFGQGNPPNGADVAFGGGVPVIIGGLPFGTNNRYAPEAPSGLPQNGDPGAENRQFLTQRSNNGFKKLESLGDKLGKVVMGIERESNLLILVVQEHDSQGMKLSEIRDSLIHLGVDDALAWDASDSATLVRDTTVSIQPGSAKNNTIPFGAGFRLR